MPITRTEIAGMSLEALRDHYRPRYLLLNLLAVERMIEQGGAVSGLWR